MDSGTVLNSIGLTGENRVMFGVGYLYRNDGEVASWFDKMEIYGKTKKILPNRMQSGYFKCAIKNSGTSYSRLNNVNQNTLLSAKQFSQTNLLSPFR